eukprot:CAMPEP_0118650188 /NCGR_PEP_ID=MMETSP0785-20121206/10112_1 /TAXON_ID=91992 /ORGANISM="Bolidomonas pacifica, Strain CCMP 1866" /LENGTH=154 /DNA_ID=CAMNT_0006542543 /DNA_START=100 /DNA_END=560 /DNA_ORIENTATION=-
MSSPPPPPSRSPSLSDAMKHIFSSFYPDGFTLKRSSTFRHYNLLVRAGVREGVNKGVNKETDTTKHIVKDTIDVDTSGNDVFAQSITAESDDGWGVEDDDEEDMEVSFKKSAPPVTNTNSIKTDLELSVSSWNLTRSDVSPLSLTPHFLDLLSS